MLHEFTFSIYKIYVLDHKFIIVVLYFFYLKIVFFICYNFGYFNIITLNIYSFTFGGKNGREK